MTTAPVADGDWVFERNLGAGAFGIVQLWVHKHDRRKLAIKKCRWDKSQLKGTQRERWQREVEIMKSFQHPNIVKAIDMPFVIHNEDIDLPILCMEYCREGDLRTVLNKPENCCGIPEVEAINAMRDTCSAVEFLHARNITHRDLKPENIVLQKQHDKITYKLIDLGYAKDLGEASTCASLVGTLNYVAPELLWREKYSSSVDYWSLGILFYELVSGTRPFLPRMPHTITWMNHIKNKRYVDICAFESDGKIIFGTDIQDPTLISRCIRHKLVNWFRVALQWDSKTRGKIRDENGVLQLVIFSLLHSIVSRKIVYIFVSALYNTYAYEVDETTTVMDLQRWLESETNILTSQQILTDYLGKPLIPNTELLSLQTNDSILFAFQTGQLLTRPSPKVPTPVQRMLEQAKNQLSYDTLQDFYRTTLFFMKEDISRFRLYIFAISIKVDLITTRLNSFHSNIMKAIGDINALSNDLDTTRSRCTSAIKDTEKMFESISLKIMKLGNAADQVNLKFEPLIKESQELREAASGIGSMHDLLEAYDNALAIYETFKKESPHKTYRAIEMVKIVFTFLRVQEASIHNEQIDEVLKRTYQLEKELLTLEKIFDSVLAVTITYREELQNIICWRQQKQINVNAQLNPVVQKNKPSTLDPEGLDFSIQLNNDQLRNVPNPLPHLNESTSSSTTSNGEGDVIYDNLVIRYTMDNLLSEMQKKYFEIMSLD